MLKNYNYFINVIQVKLVLTYLNRLNRYFDKINRRIIVFKILIVFSRKFIFRQVLKLKNNDELEYSLFYEFRYLTRIIKIDFK